MKNDEFSIVSGTEAESAWIDAKIDEFNRKEFSFADKQLEIPINYVVKEHNFVVAGIKSCFYLGEVVSIGVLFVEEKYRNRGVGSQLLIKVENEARIMGAKLSHLYAFDQTKNFYLKQGYEIFAVLENCPKDGHRCYYLKKNLVIYEKEIENINQPNSLPINREKLDEEKLNVIIRHAKVEDAHLIAEAEREIAKEPGFFCSQPSELTDENVVNTILAFHQDKTGVYLVAEYEGQIVGHAFLEPFRLKSLCHIADLNIAVHLGWQKKGIGTKLLEHIIEWAKKSAVLEKIQLNVRASNFSAISLYQKMGFKEEGRIKKWLKIKDRYIDDVIMGLDL